MLTTVRSSLTMVPPLENLTVLVVGANGPISNRLVRMLLEGGHTVRVVVQDAERAGLNLLLPKDDSTEETQVEEVQTVVDSTKDGTEIVLQQDQEEEKKKEITFDTLELTEARLFLGLAPSRLLELVKGCDVVVDCLGHDEPHHSIFSWGPYEDKDVLVFQSVRRLCLAISMNHSSSTRFILLANTSVVNPNDDDVAIQPRNTWWCSDSPAVAPAASGLGEAASHLFTKERILDWCVVRPSTKLSLLELQDDHDDFQLWKQLRPWRSSGDETITTKVVHVTTFIKELIVQPEVWEQWKNEMPVILDERKTEKKVFSR